MLNQKYISVKDINALIDRIGQFLINHRLNKALKSRNYSAEKYENLEKIAIALEVLRERRNYAQAQGANLKNKIK